MKMPKGFLDILDWVMHTNSLISAPSINYAVLYNSIANESF
jgi:hypothetical protein